MPHVVVTGAAGYIGSVLVRQLLGRGWRVTAVDSLRYGGESLVELLGTEGLRFIKADVRDEQTLSGLLCGADAVVHLAALVGDPACAGDPEYALSVNREASLSLFNMCRQAEVRRFVFASTCSNYGRMPDPLGHVDETSPLTPVSLYAETKVAVERRLLEVPRDAPCRPVVLRFATAYGLSPRMRFDLTVNEFAREVALKRELQVYGPQFWRPYCHVSDLSAAAVKALEAPEDAVAGRVFNVGATSENHTKRMLVDLLLGERPGAPIVFVEKTEDPRDYRVSFDLIKDTLGFAPRKGVIEGIREILYCVEEGFFTAPDSKRHANA